MKTKKTPTKSKPAKDQLKMRDLQPKKDAKGGVIKPKIVFNGDPCDGSEFHR